MLWDGEQAHFGKQARVVSLEWPHLHSNWVITQANPKRTFDLLPRFEVRSSKLLSG